MNAIESRQLFTFSDMSSGVTDWGSIVIISHQERILEIADEIVVISDGSILKHGTRDEILPEILGTASAPSGCQFYRREA